jgi:hypothetical protein
MLNFLFYLLLHFHFIYCDNLYFNIERDCTTNICDCLSEETACNVLLVLSRAVIDGDYDIFFMNSEMDLEGEGLFNKSVIWKSGVNGVDRIKFFVYNSTIRSMSILQISYFTFDLSNYSRDSVFFSVSGELDFNEVLITGGSSVKIMSYCAVFITDVTSVTIKASEFNNMHFNGDSQALYISLFYFSSICLILII